METLIVFCDPKAHRRSSAVVDDATARAFIEATIETAAAWRATRTAADFNRKLVLCVHADDTTLPWDIVAKDAAARVERVPDAPLGAVRAAAFAAEFDRGARSVSAIGVDTPSLPGYLLDHAFRALGFERAVVGPTFDGGAWLIGCQRKTPGDLTQLPWASPSLATMAADILDDAHVLPFWYDVHDKRSLDTLRWHSRHLDECPTALRTLTMKAAA